MDKCHCFFLRLKCCETVVHTYRSGHTLSMQIGPFNVFASQLTFPCTLIYMVYFPIRTAISYDNHESTSPTRRSFKLCTHSTKNFNSEYVVMRSGFPSFLFFFFSNASKNAQRCYSDVFFLQEPICCTRFKYKLGGKEGMFGVMCGPRLILNRRSLEKITSHSYFSSFLQALN